MANFNLNATLQGIQTFTTSCPTTDQYVITGRLSLPTAIQSAGATTSSVVTVVNQNGTPILTTTAGQRGFRVAFQGVANDTITIVTSSSNAADNASNSVKISIQMYEGGE